MWNRPSAAGSVASSTGVNQGTISYAEQYRVPFGDTDAAGVVFYPNYYRWFDRMTHELFRSIGQPLAAFTEANQAPVLAETGCRFLTSARYDDLLVLKVTVAEVRTRSFRLEHEVSRDGAAVASGFEVRIWVELADGSVGAIQIPDSVTAALKPQVQLRGV